MSGLPLPVGQASIQQHRDSIIGGAAHVLLKGGQRLCALRILAAGAA